MATQKIVRMNLGQLVVAGLVSFLTLGLSTSCGGDDTEEGACSTKDNKGCSGGQVCREGKDGRAACFCSPDTREGCPEGLECANTPNGDPGCYCSLENDTGCDAAKVCEEVPGATPTCFPPVTLGGQVFDLATKAAIADAHVVARDANFAAASGVAITDPMGHYTLEVPTKRKPDGTLLTNQITLRADAAGYVTFPTAPRLALPIEVSQAMGSPPHLESSATDVGMLALESSAGLGTVTGKVLAKRPAGTLIVAGGAIKAGGGASGVSDIDGTYTVFNVPAGSITVRGYKQGLQLDKATATVTAGATAEGVDLKEIGAAIAVVSGNVEIVNPGKGKDTSVILVVDETFIPNAARGEAPPGLRAYPVSGAFQFTDVPDGNYVVLAAFENDFLVRDPDTSIGGTDIVHIVVSGKDVPVSQSFKVTGALDVVSPDKEAVVSGVPKFVWGDDSGENHYEVRVYDAFGTKVWEKTDVPGVSGSMTVTVDYGGPALKSGMLYQFRATSIKQGGAPIAITEDLRGVFLYK